jgi:hypothetical protein
MRLTSLLAALLIAAVPGFATGADKDVDSTKRIDKRQERQDQRIEKGAKSGDLTKKEARRLEKGQDRIDAAEKRAAKDDKVTKKERARIEKMQDNQNKAIQSQRDDKQERGAAARQSASAGASAAATAAGAGNLGKLSTAQQDAFIKGEEQKAAADGFVTPEEQARLDGYYKQVQNPWRFDQYRNRDRTRE